MEKIVKKTLGPPKSQSDLDTTSKGKYWPWIVAWSGGNWDLPSIPLSSFSFLDQSCQCTMGFRIVTPPLRFQKSRILVGYYFCQKHTF